MVNMIKTESRARVKFSVNWDLGICILLRMSMLYDENSIHTIKHKARSRIATLTLSKQYMVVNSGLGDYQDDH